MSSGWCGVDVISQIYRTGPSAFVLFRDFPACGSVFRIGEAGTMNHNVGPRPLPALTRAARHPRNELAQYVHFTVQKHARPHALIASATGETRLPRLFPTLEKVVAQSVKRAWQPRRSSSPTGITPRKKHDEELSFRLGQNGSPRGIRLEGSMPTRTPKLARTVFTPTNISCFWRGQRRSKQSLSAP